MTDGGVESDRRTRVVERPTAVTAVTVVESALDRSRFVSLVGECSVEASGRPSLLAANRSVLLKPDGSVVIHGPLGTSPDLESAYESDIDVSTVGGALDVVATCDDEECRIHFNRIEVLVTIVLDPGEGRPDVDGPVGVGSSQGVDGKEGATKGVEADSDDRHSSIRERLLADPELVEPGFKPLSTERMTSAGPIDLYGRDAQHRAVAVEIKTHRAGPAAVGQLDRYVDALSRDFHADVEVRGVLVAPSATEPTRRLLREREFTFRRLALDA